MRFDDEHMLGRGVDEWDGWTEGQRDRDERRERQEPLKGAPVRVYYCICLLHLSTASVYCYSCNCRNCDGSGCRQSRCCRMSEETGGPDRRRAARCSPPASHAHGSVLTRSLPPSPRRHALSARLDLLARAPFPAPSARCATRRSSVMGRCTRNTAMSAPATELPHEPG